jgi:hypothetical protein
LLVGLLLVGLLLVGLLLVGLLLVGLLLVGLLLIQLLLIQLLLIQLLLIQLLLIQLLLIQLLLIQLLLIQLLLIQLLLIQLLLIQLLLVRLLLVRLRIRLLIWLPIRRRPGRLQVRPGIETQGVKEIKNIGDPLFWAARYQNAQPDRRDLLGLGEARKDVAVVAHTLVQRVQHHKDDRRPCQPGLMALERINDQLSPLIGKHLLGYLGVRPDGVDDPPLEALAGGRSSQLKRDGGKEPAWFICVARRVGEKEARAELAYARICAGNGAGNGRLAPASHTAEPKDTRQRGAGGPFVDLAQNIRAGAIQTFGLPIRAAAERVEGHARGDGQATEDVVVCLLSWSYFKHVSPVGGKTRKQTGRGIQAGGYLLIRKWSPKWTRALLPEMLMP